MEFWRVRAVIRTIEIVDNPFPSTELEYDTFVEDHLVVGVSREKALEKAEIHFYKKYGTDADVILIGATCIKFE